MADPTTASEEAAAAQKAHCYGGNDVAHRLRPGRSPERLAQAQAAPSSGVQPTPARVALASHTLCSAQARRQVERERAARRAQENAANTEAREEREERAREQARSGAKAKADAQARGSFGGGTGSGAGCGAARREVVFDLDLQRRGTFAEYEVDFQAFLTRAHREALVPRHVPLPPRGQAIGPATSLAEWQQNTKRALLRWHPDKWAARMQALGEVEAAQLKQLTEGMFRAVSRAKERGFLPQRWAARAD